MYAWRDLERFLIIAVATILIVRSILSAMGWPQLGGGPIHFAHLLWGGLGMVIALVLFMSMEARIWRVLAVLAAGIGFGLFIDELGKFITSDNNYFFRPAIAIVYLVFVVLVLVARFISRGVARSPQSALVNAFDLSKEAVINDMNEMQRADALTMLDRADQSDPIVQQLRAMVEGMRDLPAGAPWWLLRLRAGAERLYDRVVGSRWFNVVFIGWYAVLTVVSVGYAIRYLDAGGHGPGQALVGRPGDVLDAPSLPACSWSWASCAGAARSWRRTCGSSGRSWSRSSSTSSSPSTRTSCGRSSVWRSCWPPSWCCGS